MKSLKNTIRWGLAHLSVSTMVMLPVAQGVAAEKQSEYITKTQVQNALIEMGLNKSMTFGEFYKKNKSLYPERVQKIFEEYLAEYKNAPMPQFDLGTAKSSDGLIIPVLRLSQKGQLHNIQIFGETEKYARFNNTTLTQNDLINFDDALIRIAAGDMKLRKTNSTSSVNSPKGFPTLTKEAWVQLTPEQRAGYVISMRLLYNDAHGVLLAAGQNKKTAPTKKSKKFSFFDFLFSNDAQAAPDGPEVIYDEGSGFSNQGPAASSSSAVTSTDNGSGSCLVAGYVTKYKGKVCKYDEMKAEYKDARTIAGKAFAVCGNKIACNPLVFGTPGGQPICIDRANNADVQIATHYEGPCERGNHTNSKIKFLNNENDKQGRYDSANVTKSAAQIRAEALKEQEASMFQETKDFVAGVLKFKSPELASLFNSNNPNEEVIKQLLQIQKDFNSEIAQATEACKNASKKNTYNEKNFWGACDQLQRRFIFVAEYLNKNPGCKGGGSVNSETLMCACPSGSESAQVLPGAQCKTAQLNPPQPNPSVIDGNQPEVGKCDPACTENQECKKTQEYDGIEAWQCVSKTGTQPAKPLVDEKEKKKAERKAKLKKFGIAFGALAGAGALAGLMYLVWKPKKVKLNPAADLCPDGTTAPCSGTCTSPKVYISGLGCSCASCAPGQTIINSNTCECGSSTTTQLVCADGVTIVNDLSKCPNTSTYTCWDGTKVPNVINCPEKPLQNGTGATNQ